MGTQLMPFLLIVARQEAALKHCRGCSRSRAALWQLQTQGSAWLSRPRSHRDQPRSICSAPVGAEQRCNSSPAKPQATSATFVSSVDICLGRMSL